MWQFIAGWLLVLWRWSHLEITPALVDVWQNSETSYSKSSLGIFQHWYLADMLASVYSYRVMVKSISSCCVRGRWVLSNPVTYNTGIHAADACRHYRACYFKMDQLARYWLYSYTCSSTHNHVCILIWDNAMSHTRMGQHTHIGQNTAFTDRSNYKKPGMHLV